MPTYEYRCEACQHEFEQFQSITAKPTKKCPKCGKNRARRLIGSGGGLIFKGGGFYITDYRSENYKSSQKADAPAATTAAEGGSASTAPAAADSAKSTEKAPATPAAPKPAAAPTPKASKSASKSSRK